VAFLQTNVPDLLSPLTGRPTRLSLILWTILYLGSSTAAGISS